MIKLIEFIKKWLKRIFGVRTAEASDKYLQPSEFDASYFDGALQATRHNAGYSRYERWNRNGSEFWKDKANDWVNHLAVANKKVLELGCAKGFMVKDMRDAGVDAYGMDVSSYAIGECESGMSQYLYTGNATDLSQFSNKEFDIIISFRLLECLSDSDVTSVMNECKAKGKKQIHVVSLNANSTFYQQRTVQQWIDDFDWPKGTVIAPYGDEFNYLIK